MNSLCMKLAREVQTRTLMSKNDECRGLIPVIRDDRVNWQEHPVEEKKTKTHLWKGGLRLVKHGEQKGTGWSGMELSRYAWLSPGPDRTMPTRRADELYGLTYWSTVCSTAAFRGTFADRVDALQNDQCPIQGWWIIHSLPDDDGFQYRNILAAYYICPTSNLQTKMPRCIRA